ncbi:MAG: hypothetical protein LBQ33_05140, partial [Oscillospiraceae bacterium]|nr:hypothetical protein [Oscillospiraceae bacterium]
MQQELGRPAFQNSACPAEHSALPAEPAAAQPQTRPEWIPPSPLRKFLSTFTNIMIFVFCFLIIGGAILFTTSKD